MTRSEIIADHIATLRNLVANSDATTARLAFVRAIYAALATPGCEAQGVCLVDLPHLAERVAEMADAMERVVGERDALRAERDELAATLANEVGEGDPPVPGWLPLVPAPGRWEHPARNLVCYPVQTREYIVIVRGSLSGELAREKTARAAMRAAAGVKS